MARPDTYSIRKFASNVYLDMVNNYLSAEKFAEHQGITVDQAMRLKALFKEIHESRHTET